MLTEVANQGNNNNSSNPAAALQISGQTQQWSPQVLTSFRTVLSQSTSSNTDPLGNIFII